MLTQKCILVFLNTSEIAKLYTLNKEHHTKLSENHEIKKSIWRGDLPEASRKHFWKQCCKINKVKTEVRGILNYTDNASNIYSYIQNQAEEDPKFYTVKNDISKDLPRTYLVANSQIDKSQLSKILIALAYVKPHIGYCQGLNFIAAIILKVVQNEEDAFYALLGIIKSWNLENMFVSGVPDLTLREYQVSYYFKTMIPDLYAHFRRINFSNGFFISRCILTIFSADLPFDTLVKIWDCIFIGNWKVIVRTECAILRELKPIFLDLNLEEISIYLRNNVRENHYDYKSLLASAKSFKISLKELKYIEDDFYKVQSSLKIDSDNQTYSENEDLVKDINESEGGELDQVKQDIARFQEKIKKIDEDYETVQQHYLSVSMEMQYVEKDIASLSEKKIAYLRIYKDMENKYKQSQNGISKYVPDIMSKIFFSKNEISEADEIKLADMKKYYEKMKIIEKELEELKILQREKFSIYQDAYSRLEDIKEKKLRYSEQLCNYLLKCKQSSEISVNP
ncbi:unnamed protein product [Blepharisma stoltei]|uniref:Rab-GAP TBC domain-containing protein n=1 Tax=Blepharisma stoltei TaxID=1481888 RepID=A0AAU9JDM7_9CILI|nr:unnamed protein product [Blepharisma stoltei]